MFRDFYYDPTFVPISPEHLEGYLCVVFTVHGGCIHGSPSICIGNAFFVLGVKHRGIR